MVLEEEKAAVLPVKDTPVPRTAPRGHDRAAATFPWALLVPLAVLWAVVAVIYAISSRQQQGHFIYCLDDAYIHMAIAKHFAQAGVWGVTRDGFTSSASSLLWPLLIAGIFRLLGPNVATQFLLNLLLASLLLFVGYRLLRRQGVPTPGIAVALLLFVIAVPLPTMIFTGMEHCLQALVALLFVHCAARAIGDRATTVQKWGQARMSTFPLCGGHPSQSPFLHGSGDRAPEHDAGLLCLYLLAPILTLVRFEGLFIAFAACLLLLLRRKVLSALIVGAGALIPVAVYAWISLSHGWLWMPNSVLLKSTMPTLTTLHGLLSFFTLFAKRIFTVPGVWQVLAPALALYLLQGRRTRQWWSYSQSLLLLFLLLMLLHGATAGKPVFYRYEAYLIALGIFVCAAPLSALFIDWRSRPVSRWTLAHGAVLACFACILLDLANTRGLTALETTPRACTNIYQQQMQMARFLGRYYPGAAIAANDIGAINYFNDIHCLDMVGLANMPIARKMRAHALDRAALAEINQAAGVRVAIFYRHWFHNKIPFSWTEVASWEIPQNVVCGGYEVAFYAVNADEVVPLINHLNAFRAQLPHEVITVFQPGMIALARKTAGKPSTLP